MICEDHHTFVDVTPLLSDGGGDKSYGRSTGISCTEATNSTGVLKKMLIELTASTLVLKDRAQTTHCTQREDFF